MRKKALAVLLACAVILGGTSLDSAAFAVRAEEDVAPAATTATTATDVTEVTEVTKEDPVLQDAPSPNKVESAVKAIEEVAPAAEAEVSEEKAAPEEIVSSFTDFVIYEKGTSQQPLIKRNLNQGESLTLLPGALFEMRLANGSPIEVDGFTGEYATFFTTGDDENPTTFVLSPEATPGVHDISYSYTGDVDSDGIEEKITATLHLTVVECIEADLHLVKEDASTPFYVNTSQTEMLQNKETLQLALLDRYPIDGKNFFMGGLEPVGVTWGSSDSAVAAVDAAGKVTAKSIGACTITAKVGAIEKKLTLSVQEPGIYVTQYEENITVPVGSPFGRDIVQTILGDDLLPTSQPDSFESNMVLDEKTRADLNSRGLLGIKTREQSSISFTPDKNRHTVSSIKGVSLDVPYLPSTSDLVGTTLSGWIVYPKKEVCNGKGHLTSPNWSFEDCDCYLDDANLNDVVLTKPDGSVTTVKRVPFSYSIVENTRNRNMDLIQAINSQDGGITRAQNHYLSNMMYQVIRGEGMGGTEFSKEDYSAEDLGAIQQAVDKAATGITYSVASDVSVSNLFACAAMNKVEFLEQIPEQEIGFVKTDSEPGAAAKELIENDAQMVDSFDFSVQRTRSGENSVAITETPVPLEVTVQLDEDLSGQDVSVIREHKNADGTIAAKVLSAQVSADNKVTFESDCYSTFTFVKKPSPPEEPENPGTPENPGAGGAGNGGAGTDTPNPSKPVFKNVNTVKTGDSTSAGTWAALCGIGVLAAVIAFRKRFTK